MAYIGPHEGVKYKAYRDSGGIWTICYGHTKNVKEGMVVDESQCKTWFEEDTTAAIEAVDRLTDSAPIPPNAKKVFVDQVFNAGSGSFETSTMRKLIRQGDFAGACMQFMRWNKITVPKGGVSDMRDGIKDGKADCNIRANNCYGLITRRIDQTSTCLQGLKQ